MLLAMNTCSSTHALFAALLQQLVSTVHGIPCDFGSATEVPLIVMKFGCIARLSELRTSIGSGGSIVPIGIRFVALSGRSDSTATDADEGGSRRGGRGDVLEKYHDNLKLGLSCGWWLFWIL